MKYYAVIDTNVLVSALLKEHSIPWQILQYIFDGVIIPIYNKEIILEYAEVLSRNKFGFSKKNINKIINKIIVDGEKK